MKKYILTADDIATLDKLNDSLDNVLRQAWTDVHEETREEMANLQGQLQDI